MGLTVTIVILVLVLGLGSGALGSYLVYRHFAAALSKAQSSAEGILATASAGSSADVVNIVKKASPAVVSIIVSKDLASQQAQDGTAGSAASTSPFFLNPFPQPSKPNFQEVGAGSGFFITSDGMILTNKHVVEDAAAHYAVYTSDGTRYDATVLSRDPLNDLALVKVSITGAPTLSMGDSSKIQIGQKVIAIGDSLGQYTNTVTTGIVSGTGRTVTAGDEGTSETLDGVVQTDAAINPGNSGGPLLDLNGLVIGVNTAIDEQGQLVGFAIPSNDAEKDVQRYQQYGKIVKPFLGVQYVLLDPEIAQENKLPVQYGAWINTSDSTPSIVAGSAADKGGLKDGDIITSVNGVQLGKDSTLSGAIKDMNPGDKVTLSVTRSGKSFTLTVTLGEK